MQRASSGSSSAQGTAGSGGDRRLLQGLHSPGDASPGIQFTRGSFSDHLLSLESPSANPRQQPSQIQVRPQPQPQPILQRPRSLHATAASGKASAATTTTRTTTTTSLLRSPTRKRPPPVPASAPKAPPTSIRSRATAAASSILMPPAPPPPRTARAAPPSSSSSLSSPVSHESKTDPATVSRVETTTQSSSDTQSFDPRAVNPVDALAKKLRQQATELTQVYEQMEKKDTELEQLRGDVKQLTMQLDMQRNRQRSTMASRATASRPPFSSFSASSSPSRPTGLVGKTSTRRVSGVVGGSSGNRKPVDVTTPATPQERQNQATQDLAIRMEESMTELRRVHRELLAQSGTTIDATDVQHEQQLYIRVLEEAVHLKASELCITGHEELLVVLAELRHTIYQQEHEIGKLQKSLSTVQSEHLQCKSAQLEADDKVQRETSRLEMENHACTQREASLHRKLEELQRLAHTEHMRFRQERATQEKLATRLSTLEKELQSRTHELHQWETTRLETWTQKEGAMAKQIQELQTVVDNERVRASRMKEDLEKTHRQVDELKALQEGLLQSIDQFVTKEDAQEQQIKRFQAQVETMQQLNGENEMLRSVSEESRKQVAVLELQATERQWLAAKWEQVETTNRQIAEATDTVTELGQNEEIKPLELWLQVLSTAAESTSCLLPWLQVFVNVARSTLSETRHRVHELEKERDVLRESTAQFEQTNIVASGERERLQAQLLETQTKLIQTELEAEECNLQITAMNEELRDAQAQQHLRNALATQIFQQENLLKTQQQRLELVVLQNAELMALETQLAAQLEQKEREIEELQHAFQQYKDQETLLHEMERELEDAASLTEQQNAWNQQLTVELEHLELEKSDQDDRVETMATRERFFVARFSALFTQYAQFVSVHRQRRIHEFSVSGQLGEKGSNQALASELMPDTTVYHDALQSQDVLQMVRVFPTLVGEYLANAVVVRGSETKIPRGNKLSRSRAPQEDSVPLGNESSAARVHSHSHVAPRPPARKKQTTAPLDRTLLTRTTDTTRIDAIADEFKPLDEELREVAMAFSQFKSH